MRFIPLLLISAIIAGCATTPPRNVENACYIFNEKPDWYKASMAAEEKYGLPMQVQLAIMRQESSFKHDAAPPRDTFLGVLCGGVYLQLMGMRRRKIPLGIGTRVKRAGSGLAVKTMLMPSILWDGMRAFRSVR